MQNRSSSMDFKSLHEQMSAIISSVDARDLTENNLYAKENRRAFSRIQRLLEQLAQTMPRETLTAQNVKPLCDLMAERAAVIINTDIDYTISPNLPVNIAYLALAQHLESICGKSRYQLLMPEIEVTVNEITTTDLKDNSLELRHFIKSDDNKRFIEVYACLEAAETDGVLKHTSLFNGEAKVLSASEAERIINHSKEVKNYYDAIMLMVNAKTKGASFGAALSRLAEDLRNGGKRRAVAEEKRHLYRQQESQHKSRSSLMPFEKKHVIMRVEPSETVETNAIRNANEGIVFFAQWLETLSATDQSILLGCISSGGNVQMTDIWQRLARPLDSNFLDNIYCVDGLADFIQVILKDNSWLFDTYPSNTENTRLKSIAQLNYGVEEARKQFVASVRSNDYQITASYGKEKSLENLSRQCGPMIDNIQSLQDSLAGMSVEQARFLFLSMKQDLLKIMMVDSEQYKQALLYIDKKFYSVLHECLAIQLAKSLTSKSELVELLKIYPAPYQPQLISVLASRFSEFFSSYDQIISVLQTLPKASKIYFLENADSLLTSVIKSYDQLVVFIGAVGAEYAEIIFRKLNDTLPQMIKNHDQLCALLRMISKSRETQKIIIVNIKHKLSELIKNREQFDAVLQSLDIVGKTALIELLGEAGVKLITDGEQLMHVLYYTTTRAHRIILKYKAEQIKSLIKNRDQFFRVISVVVPEDVVTVLQLLGDQILQYITNAKDLLLLIQRLNEQDQLIPLGLLSKHLDKLIIAADDLDSLLEIMPKHTAELLKLFDKQQPRLVREGKHLIAMLKWQPAGEERVAFIERFSDRLLRLIENGNNLADILSLLPDSYCAVFLKHIAHKLPDIIKNHEQFASVAALLNDNLQVMLMDNMVSQIASFTSTAEQLFLVSKSLTVSNRFALADYLIEKDRLTSAVENNVQLVDFLKLFTDIEMRWKFLLYFAKKSPELRQYVKSDAALVKVLDLLPNKDADLIKLLGDYLASFIHTRKQFDNIQQHISLDSFGLLVKALGEHFPAIYRQASPQSPNLFRETLIAQGKSKRFSKRQC